MLVNGRVKAGIYYLILTVLFSIFIFTFIFSSKSFFSIKNKEELLREKIKTTQSLQAEIKQTQQNILRLQTDREYIISYAKTFGYLDKTKNEKLIKIIDEDQNISYEKVMFKEAVGKKIENIKPEDYKINITGILILSLLMAGSIGFYALVIHRQNIQKR